MTAPALVLLAQGSIDSSAMAAVHAMRKCMQEQRPDVPTQLAFMEHCPPSGPQVVSQLARRGVEEVVFVSMDIGNISTADDDAQEIVERTRLAHPELRIVMARPLGPDPTLLSVVDTRLRQALAARRVDALDGLVLSAHGSRDSRSRGLLARRCRQWATHHRIPATVAYADGSGPSVGEAIRQLHGEGRRHVGVASWFVTGSNAWRNQAEAALAAGAVAVGAPLGNEPQVRELIAARYVVAAMSMLDFDQTRPATAVC